MFLEDFPTKFEEKNVTICKDSHFIQQIFLIGVLTPFVRMF